MMRTKPLGVWNSGLLGTVQEYEEKAIEAAKALESNLEILIRLRTFYNDLAHRGLPKPDRRAAGDSIREFIARADELMSDLRTQISRIHVLEKQVADRKTIVSFPSQAQYPPRVRGLKRDYKLLIPLVS